MDDDCFIEDVVVVSDSDTCSSESGIDVPTYKKIKVDRYEDVRYVYQYSHHQLQVIITVVYFCSFSFDMAVMKEDPIDCDEVVIVEEKK